MNTLVPVDFKAFVMKAVRENEKKFVIKKKMDIEVSAKFKELFKKSDMISSKTDG